jgi:hypothetical protein
MMSTKFAVKAFANDSLIVHHDAPNQWIGSGSSHRFFGEFKAT